MKLLQRYIFREHLAPFLGGLWVLLVILLLDRIFDLMEMIFRKGLPVRVVLELFGFSLPFMIALAVPMAVLIATLVAFGRFSADFEILAMKAAGMNIRQILTPALLFGLFWFVVMSVFNNTILPESNHRLKNLMLDISLKKPTQEIEEGIFNRMDSYLIYVGKKDERTNEIQEVMIQQKTEEGVQTIFAKRGQMYTLKNDLILDLEDGEIHLATGPEGETYRRLKFKTHRVVIPIQQTWVRRKRTFRTDREMSGRMLLREIRKLEKDIQKVPEEQRLRLQILQRKRNQYLVELHKKFSIPFASLAFILIGVPLAIRSRRGGYGTAFGIAFLLFMVYYIFLIGGEELADRLIVPAWSVWVPNILYSTLGIFLLFKE